jgi:hypothetical protein
MHPIDKGLDAAFTWGILVGSVFAMRGMGYLSHFCQWQDIAKFIGMAVFDNFVLALLAWLALFTTCLIALNTVRYVL